MTTSLLPRFAPAALFLASSVALAESPSAAPRRVAVLDFSASWAGECGGAALDTARREQCELLRILADQARGGALAALGPPAFVVMTRENTAQILKDMGGACAEGECEVETARLIGASLVVSGEVSLMEGIWIVSLKAHDVTTAALVATGNVQGRTKLELFGNVRAETERMLGATVGYQGPVGFPGVSRPPVVAGERPAEPSRLKRVYLSFQAGTGVAWGPIEGLSGKALGDAQLLGAVGYRLGQEWAIEAGGGYVNFFKDDLPGTSDFVEVKALSFFGAAAWHPKGVRYFSFAAELGYDQTSYRLTADSVADDSASKGMAHAGIEARADWPLGPIALGVRAGIRVYRQGVSRVSDGLRWVDAGVIVVLPAAVAATVYF